jgi:6-phosphogluconolactonase
VSLELRVLDDPAEEAARLLAEAARAGGAVALSGGSTPKPAYRRAAELEPDWSRVEIFLADDRCVPPEDERSNFRLVRESLGGVGARIHRIQGELPPEEAAARYDEVVRGRTLDLALLGIGADGHTASLFPNAPALDERERAAVAAEPGMEPFVPRVTLTLPILNAAGLAVFLVTGAEKRAAAARAFASEPSPATPASLVRGARTVVLLDEDAGSDLHFDAI